MKLIDYSSLLNLFAKNKKKNIAKRIAIFLSPVYIKAYLIFLTIINLFIWSTAYYINSKIDNERMALHYNVDFGIDYYDSSEKIYIIPFLGLIIILINSFIGIITNEYRDRRFISHILFSAALISNIVLTAAIASIYLINFR